MFEISSAYLYSTDVWYGGDREIKQLCSVINRMIICSGTLKKIYINFSAVTELAR
jgi:hypothetical protein